MTPSELEGMSRAEKLALLEQLKESQPKFIIQPVAVGANRCPDCEKMHRHNVEIDI